MPTNPSDILVAGPDQLVTGAILSAELGTPLPTGPADKFASYTDSGFVSKDGLIMKINKSTEEIRDWSYQTQRTIVKEFSGKLSWSFLSTDKFTLESVFGKTNVEEITASGTVGASLKVSVSNHELPMRVWAFKMKDGPRRVLVVVPKGQITKLDDVTFKNGQAATWPVELTAYPDERGNSIYLHYENGKALADSLPEQEDS